MTYQQHDQTYLLRLFPGEELNATLLTFCQDHHIIGGWISGLGAAREVELAFFNVHTKTYATKVFSGEFEVVNITGNISAEKLHLHITIGDKDFQAYAGHCNRAIADPTLEVRIEPFSETHRTLDDYSGLQLLDLA